MDQAVTAALATPREAKSALERLFVIAELGSLLVALPATQVRRLLLVSEMVRIDGGINFEGARLATFELGALFGVATAREACVLVDVASKTVGLVTGRCLAVRELPARLRLPLGAFARRGRAVRSAFALTTGSSVRTGIELDLRALVSADELARALRGVAAPR
jgi:hypothetical protein